jgi:hypothetical protein
MMFQGCDKMLNKIDENTTEKRLPCASHKAGAILRINGGISSG